MDAQRLVDLLLAHPDITRALKRHPDTNDTFHTIQDTLLAEAALCDKWDESDIVDLIREGNARSARYNVSQAYCALLIEEARARLNGEGQGVAHEANLEIVAQHWRLPIKQVIKHGKENAIWHLILEDGREIQLGTTKKFLSQNDVRRAIFDVTHKVIPPYRAHETHIWHAHIEFLANAATIIDTPEITRSGHGRQLVQHYLRSQFCALDHDIAEEEWEDIALASRPYVRKNVLYISPDHMWHFIHRSEPKLEKSELYDFFRTLGGRRRTVGIKKKKTSRSYWLFNPTDFQEEPQDEEIPAYDEVLNALTRINGEKSVNSSNISKI